MASSTQTAIRWTQVTPKLCRGDYHDTRFPTAKESAKFWWYEVYLDDEGYATPPKNPIWKGCLVGSGNRYHAEVWGHSAAEVKVALQDRLDRSRREHAWFEYMRDNDPPRECTCGL